MTQKFKRELPVELTSAEIEEKAQELARLTVEYSDTDAQRKVDHASYTLRLKSLDTQLNDVAKVIKARAVVRPVECEQRKVFEQNLVQVVRLDTGAVISERGMTVEERQGDFFEPPAEPPVAAEGDDDEDVTLDGVKNPVEDRAIEAIDAKAKRRGRPKKAAAAPEGDDHPIFDKANEGPEHGKQTNGEVKSEEVVL